MLPVIVFGAALYPDGSPSPALIARIHAAFRFGQQHDDVMYVVTGGVPQAGKTEAAVMAQMLREQGVAEEAILPEAESGDTCDSVIACTRLLRARGYVGPVVAVTSDFHCMRCVAMLRALGWVVLPVAAPSRTDIAPFRRWWIRTREYPATVWDVFLVMLWRITKGRHL
ncbi:YdcF family protein [Acetobacter sp.]|uniref:YdcF family protein n=1 Tax=Acetobacter sp. TaxID=440 RepID=UPI0039E84DDF